jgi:hypothetical protein
VDVVDGSQVLRNSGGACYAVYSGKMLSMTRFGFYGSIGGYAESGLWLYRPCVVKVHANADWMCLIANMKRTSSGQCSINKVPGLGSLLPPAI